MTRGVWLALALVLVALGFLAGLLAGNGAASASSTRLVRPFPALQVPPPVGCILVAPGVFVDLRNDRTPESIEHVRDAVRAGQPRILHLDRAHADEHRAASLRGHQTSPGRDLDEYPPALSREGGAGADVRSVLRSDNRSAGSTMGLQLRPFCDSQAFIIEP